MYLQWFHRQQKAIITVCVGVVFLTGTCLQCIGAWQDSQTSDEAVHLTAGYSYLRTGDFRVNPEHPPLVKVLAAIPLLFVPGLQLQTHDPAWQLGSLNEWGLSARFLYDNIVPARLLMFLGRLPMIVLWFGLAGLIWWWARQRWSAAAGLLGLVFFVFDPNFLGHGHLVTTDVGVSLGIFASVWAADRYFRRSTWANLGVLSAIFALTQLTKFSALILWLIIPLLGLIRLAYRPPWPSRFFWRMMGGLIFATAVFSWIIYGFHSQSMTHDFRFQQLWQARQLLVGDSLADQPTLIQHLVHWTEPTAFLGRLVSFLKPIPIPAYNYWSGLLTLMSHDYWGHPAYLFGQTSTTGWWYYFPIAMLLKTPLVSLVALLMVAGIGLTRWIRRRRQLHRWPHIPFEAYVFGLPPLVYILWSFTSHINIGLRHIFPVYPFLFLGIASLAAVKTTRAPGWWRGFLIAGGLFITMTALRSWPNTIGYFNAAAGGTRNGTRYLLDSNIDWDQDFWRLRAWLDQQHFRRVHISLFGSIPLENVFPEALPVLTSDMVDRGSVPQDIVITSVNLLYNPDDRLQWLQSYQPRWRIGSSIYVYDFR